MTRSRSGNSGTGIPGLTKFQELASAYFGLWEQQVRAVNAVWTRVTRSDSTPSDWPQAWNELLHTWAENIENACMSLGVGGVFGHGGAPLVAFAIDRAAQSDAGPQTIPLPIGIDPQNLIATPLVSLTQDGHPELGRASILLLPTALGLEIRVTVKHDPNDMPPPGYYLALVCEPRAGDPRGNPLTNSLDPPARTVVAVVLVHFI